MKRLAAALLLLTAAATAQSGTAVLIPFTGAPTGTCAPVMIAVNTSNADFYDCLSGSWNKVNSAGGVTSVFTRTGAVVATTGDYAVAQVTGAAPLASPTFTGHVTVEGVTATGATGTGKFVFDGTPTLVTPVLGVATATSIAVGTSPPTCTSGTAGVLCMNEGTAPTAATAVSQIFSNSTTHELGGNTNGGGNGMLVMTRPSSIRSTGLTGAVSTATLCAASAGACNQAGQYHVHWTFYESGTACGTPGTGGVTFLLTWTDGNATAHSAISLSMDDGSSLVATTATFHFQTTLAAAWASGDFNIDTNGSIIQYATGYTACSVGTGTYALSAAITRLQ